MNKEIVVTSLESIDEAARELLVFSEDSRIFAFYGEMGAGKTTFIKAVCKILKVEDNVSSPTFSIVNEYLSQEGEKIFHFDFYRIKNENEAYDMGCEEYFYSGNHCFIEWPEKIHNLLPSKLVLVRIVEKEGKRFINLQKTKST